MGLSDNVRYTYDASADAGSHITGIWVNGKRVTDDATYRIGSFSFLLAGGDNFKEFAKGTDTKDSGLVDYQAWISYLTKQSPVSPKFAKHGVEVQAASTATVGGGLPDQDLEPGPDLARFACEHLAQGDRGRPDGREPHPGDPTVQRTSRSPCPIAARWS